jgi:DNA-binding MarR family transcriptional regulator
VELLDRWRVAARRDRIAVGRQLGLDPTESAALWALSAVDAPTPGTLRRQLLLTSGGVAALIGRLERRGVLTRERHPSDGRSAVLRVTPSFLERARALLAPLGGAVDTVAAALDETERRIVACCLEEAAASVEEEADRLLRGRGGESCAVQQGGPIPALWA